MVRTKVFVGNLSFATKENELAKEFEVSGKVISANIITRGPRSLGYGFVEMDNEVDAENAVKLLDKKEIDGRPINVEVAKAREEGSEDNKGQGGQRGGRGGSRGSGSGRGSRGNGGFRGGNRGGNGGFRGGFNGGNQGEGRDGNSKVEEGGFRRRFKRREDEGEEGGNDNRDNREDRRGGLGRGRGGRGRGSRGNGNGNGRDFTPRPKRDEKKEDTRAPSQTTLFVANLPFTLDDDAFAKILKDENLAYKSAHVVKKRSGRSKGFGFVEFENEVDQQKALTAINNKSVEGRELVVKVALTENKSEDSNENSNTTTTNTNTTASTEKKEEEKKSSNY